MKVIIEPTTSLRETNGILPKRMTSGSVGFDVHAAEGVIILPRETVMVPLGFKMEIEKGYWAMLAPRSSLFKKNLSVPNSVGIIDSDYRDEVRMLLFNFGHDNSVINEHDRIGQLIFLPMLEIELEQGFIGKLGERVGGFGSTS